MIFLFIYNLSPFISRAFYKFVQQNLFDEKMKSFDGIIFDVDGTLTSTHKLIFASFRKVGEKYLGRTLSDAEIASNFGPPEDVILKEWGKDKFEEAKSDYYNFYSDNHHLAKLYPGIKEVLSLLKSRNVLTAIFTGKGRTAADITLLKLGVAKYFDMIITGDDVVNHKPNAEGIINFLNKYELDKERVLMIGDLPQDIYAARSAGVKVASALWDSYAAEKVLTLNSDYVFHKVSGLEKFLEENV